MSEQKKKNNAVVLVIIIILVAAIGGYAVFDTQNKNKSTAEITTTMQETTTAVKSTETTTTTTNKYEKYLGKWHGEVSSSSGGWLSVDLNINNLTNSVCSGKITIDGTEYYISASYEYGAYNATISTEYSVKINIDDSLKINTEIEMYSNYVLYDTYTGNLYSSN